MNGTHHRIASPQLGRHVHVWTYGSFGAPVLVFPSAAGMAHEWQAEGMIDALGPLLRAGRIKLYCPESNVAEAWTRSEGSPEWRISRHLAYERFVLETLVPAIREDCRTPGIPITTVGCSLGAMYAVNAALKQPRIFRTGIGMSGRYEVRGFTHGYDSIDVYYNNPIAYVPNLHGDALRRIRSNTRILLVCGQGRYEEGCIEETRALSGLLHAKGITHECDMWGHDSAHDWAWWRRQAVYHFNRLF